MPKLSKQSTNHNFTVHMEKTVLASNPTIETGAYAVVRDDNNAVVGNVSKRYGVVQNPHLVDAIRAQFQKMGIGADKMDERFFVSGAGERMFAEFTFKEARDTSIEIAKGDVLGYRATFRNSFNGTQKVALSLGFMRYICTNGMSSMSPDLNIMEKHHSQVALDFLPDAIEKAFVSARSEANIFADMAGAAIEMEQGQRILLNLVACGAMSERLRKTVESVWLNPPYEADAARNVYNLYNALTYVLTREVENRRYELAQRINFRVLNRLLTASRDTDAMNKLCVKLEPVTSSVEVIVAN